METQRPSARLLNSRVYDHESTRFRRAGDLDISQGPRHDRSCTDVPCGLLFVVAWALVLGLFVIGIEKGDPQQLMRFIRGKDVLGQTCGLPPNQDFPLTYFTVPVGTAINGSTPSAENLKPVCTSSCPQGGKRGIVVGRSAGDCPEELSKMKLCSWYGGDTTRIANYCLDADVFDIPNESWQTMLQNVKLSYPVLLASVPVALITGYLFLSFVRWCAGACIWTALLGHVAFFAIFGYKVYMDKDAIAEKHGMKKEYVACGAYFLWAMSAVVLLFSICFCNTIKKCTALLKTACMFLQDVKSQMLQPLVFAVVHVSFYAFWIVVALYVATIGMKSDSSATVDNQTLCFKEKDPFCIKWDSNLHIYAMAYLIVMLYWGVNFLHAVSQHATAYAVGVWYFAPTNFQHGAAVKIISGNLTCRGICLGIGYHLGSLAFGSLVVTAAELIRLLFWWAKQREASSANPISRILIAVSNCVAQCLERCLIFISSQGYIQIALTGKGFCRSCGIAGAMFIRHPVRFGFLYKASLLIEFLGVVLVSAVTTLVAYVALVMLPQSVLPQMATVSLVGPLTIVAVGAGLIGMLIVHPLSIACAASLHCFSADGEMENAAGFGGPQHTPAPLQHFLET